MQPNMYFSKFFSLISLLVLLFSQDTSSQQIVCGAALNAILRDVCTDEYYKMPLPKKRSDLLYNGEGGVISGTNLLPLPYRGVTSLLLGNIMGNDVANTMAKTRRRRYGIAYECCFKGCTYKELTSYCS